MDSSSTRMTDTLQAILAATLASGILDATAASLQAAVTLKVKPPRVFQGVASGLLGPRAFEAGASAAILGLALHFLIAFIISTIYILAAQRLPFLLDHPLIAGGLYGIAVFLVMFYIVLPLSRRPRRPFNLKFALTQLAIHIVIIGWSIALSARYFLLH
jgi:uncharacterized membrane protein YagU involved in acid resistance